MNLKSRILEAIDNGITKSLIDFGNNKILKSEYVDSDGLYLKKNFDDWYRHNNIGSINDHTNVPDDLEFPDDLYNQLIKMHKPIIEIDTKKDLEVLIEIVLNSQGTNANLNWIDTTNITDMSYLFSFSDFDGDVSKWYVDSVTNMDSMFNNCSLFNCDLSKWHVNCVTNMDSMFDGCSSFNCDLSNWHVDNVTNMKSMFCKCSSFNSDLSNWHVDRVTDMRFMFLDCSSFNSDLSNWHVDNVTNMGFMFYGCSSFNSDLSNWHVDNVTNMTCIFDGCKKFNSDLSNWHVDNVTNMVSMFSGCKSFTGDISNWKFKKCRNMDRMFYQIGDNVSIIIEVLNKMGFSKNYIKKSMSLFTFTLNTHINGVSKKTYDEGNLLNFISVNNKSYIYKVNFINELVEYTDKLILDNYEEKLKNIKNKSNEKITKATNAILILRKNSDITNNYTIRQARTGAYKISNDDTEITVNVSEPQIYYTYMSSLSFRKKKEKYYYHGNDRITYGIPIQNMNKMPSSKIMFDTAEELVDSLMDLPWFNFPWTEYEEI